MTEEPTTSPRELSRSRAVLVYNPVAGVAGGDRTPEELERLARSRFAECVRIDTARRGHEAEVGERLARDPPDYVLVGGGDGTLSGLVDGWMRHRSAQQRDPIFVPLRLGSGSDFARGLGIPADPSLALDHLARTPVVRIDVGRIEFGPAGGRDRYWVNQSYVGLGAAVVARVNRRSGARNQGAYVRSTVREVIGWRPVGVEIAGFDGAPGNFDLTNLLVTNGPYSGSGMLTSPHADPSDGRWEVVAVGRIPRLRLLRELGRFRTGEHLGRPGVSLWSATRVELRAVDPSANVPVEADGDVVGRLPARYELLAGAIRMPFVPRR